MELQGPPQELRIATPRAPQAAEPTRRVPVGDVCKDAQKREGFYGREDGVGVGAEMRARQVGRVGRLAQPCQVARRLEDWRTDRCTHAQGLFCCVALCCVVYSTVSCCVVFVSVQAVLSQCGEDAASIDAGQPQKDRGRITLASGMTGTSGMV
eukprot:161426-Chlamydomonas_euryale.AAC.1